MHEETQQRENEVENDPDRKKTEDSSNESDPSVISTNGNKKEADPVEIDVSDYGEQNAEQPPIEALHSEPEKNSQKVIHGVDISTSEDLDLKRVHLETVTHAEEEDESNKEESTAAADKAGISHVEQTQLLQDLYEERERAIQHSNHLQTKLAEYFRKKAGDITQLEKQGQVTDQLQEYEKCIQILSDLNQQLAADTESVQQRAEGLRLQCQEKLDEVENEWRAFMTLKQDVAVTVLSQHLGKQAAQAKVEATLAAEQLRQAQLIKLRLRYIKLKVRINRLEAELRDEDERGRDPLQLQFEQLQAQRLEQKQHIERQSEEVLKLQKKISSSLELLSNVKEKVYWNKMEVMAKREQLADVEANVSRKRDLLTRTKQVRNRLQKDNQSLKERHGLLGKRILLRDFEDTVDAADQLEEQLRNLQCRQTEIGFS